MPANSEEVFHFKKIISECKGGNFKTHEIHVFKKRLFEQAHGNDLELGSWKQVVDRHGSNVAYAALKQGNLPYIPHTLLSPGHGVAWPESHEFILTRKFWKVTWRTEIHYRGSEKADTAKEQEMILDWLKSEGDSPCSGTDTWESMQGRLQTGIPVGMPNPAPPPLNPPKVCHNPRRSGPSTPITTAHDTKNYTRKS